MQLPRPQWNHKEVKTAAVAGIVGDIVAWAKARDVRYESDDGSHREFTAFLTLSILESADAYEAARYLDNHCEWPVDGEMVRLIDRAYAAMPFLTTSFVHAWVMQNGIRFPAKKGNTVRFSMGGVEFTGVVVEVIQREARGLVEVLNIKERGRIITVPAEDVTKVTSTGDGRPPPPTPPSDGGTPASARSGAPLKRIAA